ncbi:unnamed protein product [Rhizoctonia solani]|uniref:Uncharacterized protein n=1 Tax=Rhizoctonia solani TaxID=456999 RepID=A0A8H3BRS9_9AGAM|nr:unnamed protein product [Rhizoctonia solani]
MPHAIPQDMVFHSKKLKSVRVKMPGGKIYQWPIIERPENLASIHHLDTVMQMPMAMLRIIQKTIRDETKRQIGHPFDTVRWKFVHQRVKDYVVAKNIQFLCGFLAETKRALEMKASASRETTDILETPEISKRRCLTWSMTRSQEVDGPF